MRGEEDIPEDEFLGDLLFVRNEVDSVWLVTSQLEIVVVFTTRHHKKN